jgi:hypothetical protein
MQKVYSGFAAAAALTLLVSAGQACPMHTQVTASADTLQEGASMSTYDGADAPAIVNEAADTTCAPGATNCTPTSE